MAKRSLTAKQKSALAKGQKLMKKAVSIQKQAGTKTKTVKAGGKSQKVEVYKINLKNALKKASGQGKLF